MLSLLIFATTCAIASADPSVDAAPMALQLVDLDYREQTEAALPKPGLLDTEIAGATQVDIFTAPVLPSWPEDTVEPLRLDGGWFVEDNTARLLVRDALLYPLACQASLDALHQYDTSVKNNELDAVRDGFAQQLAAVNRDHAGKLEVAEAKGWRWYQVALTVGGIAAVSFATGYAVGHL